MSPQYLEIAAKASYAKAIVTVGDKSFELRRLSAKLGSTPEQSDIRTQWLPVELWNYLREAYTDDREFIKLFA